MYCHRVLKWSVYLYRVWSDVVLQVGTNHLCPLPLHKEEVVCCAMLGNQWLVLADHFKHLSLLFSFFPSAYRKQGRICMDKIRLMCAGVPCCGWSPICFLHAFDFSPKWSTLALNNRWFRRSRWTVMNQARSFCDSCHNASISIVHYICMYRAFLFQVIHYMAYALGF